MSEQADQLRRRKNILRGKAASFGYSTPPEISTELEDIDKVLQLITLVDICRQRLAILVRQSEQFGTVRVPPHVENEITSTRQTIANYKEQAARLRHPIDDHPLDTAGVQSYTITSVPIDNWRERIESKLDQILFLLQERTS